MFVCTKKQIAFVVNNSVIAAYMFNVISKLNHSTVAMTALTVVRIDDGMLCYGEET